MDDLHHRSLRDLLLPRDRAAPGARRRLRRERVSADQRRSQTRSLLQSAADAVQDAQRVRAAERRGPRRLVGRRRGVRRADERPHAATDRRAARPAVRPHYARADAHLRVRHHPAVAHPPQRAAVGERRAVGLRARAVESDRSHVGARRGGRRHRAEDDRARRLRQHEQPETHLQPRSRGLRVHRGEVREGRHPPVPVRAAQERHRRRRGRVRRSAPHEEGRVRSGLRALSEGSVQAVPRQGAAGRLRPRSLAEPREDQLRRRLHDRAVALGRSDGDRDRESKRPRARRDPAVDQGRLDRPQPHARLRQGHGLRSHRLHGRAVRDAVDGVVAEGRSARVLRAHREGADAHRPERAHARCRAADPDGDGRRARVAELLARRPDDCVRRAARRRRRYLHDRSAVEGDRQSDRRQVLRRGAGVLARRHVHHL